MLRLNVSPRTMFLFITVSVVTMACGVGDVATEAQDIAAAPTPQEAFVCDGSEPGVPIPLSREEEYVLCENQCRPTYPRTYCDALCCLEVTSRPGVSGCRQCFFQ